MTTYKITDKSENDHVVIAVFQARDLSEAEVIGREHAMAAGKPYGLWVQQAAGGWLEVP